MAEPDENAANPNPGGLSPEESRAASDVTRRVSAAGSTWQPPTDEEIAQLFPQYEMLGMLGCGGMGAVYKARQVALDRFVALKLLPLEISVDQGFADRFVREARAMAKLNHPNILDVYDFGVTEGGHLFFVMEFVDGANLHSIIYGQGLNPDQALWLAGQICDALAYAHSKGVVHRDIKPANVMVSMEGNAKVADFGLARLTGPGTEHFSQTQTGTVMGTPDYMAPEQKRAMNVDHRADIYSLGVMLYEMLCRETPQGIFDPPSAKTGCDTRIDQIVVKAMQAGPERRYQSTEEMKAEVDAARVPLPMPQPQAATEFRATSTASGGSQPLAKSNTLLYVGIAAAMVALVGVLVFFNRPKLRASLPATTNTLATKPGKTIHLLPLVDVPRDAVKGKWSMKPEGLSLDWTGEFGVCELPYEPPAEYDFEVEFSPQTGGLNPNLYLSVAGTSFAWKIDAHGRTLHGFDLLDGALMTARTDGFVKQAPTLVTQQRYTTRVEVRQGSLRGVLDGTELVAWSGDFQRLSMEAGCRLRNERSLGVGAYKRSVIFHRIDVREVSGAGKLTR